MGVKVAGQDYGSVHGVMSGNNIEYHDVSVYVRSKPELVALIPITINGMHYN